MKKLLKNGFTLVELMIVIAIIGILSAALTTQMPRVRESARAMRCKANLRNLAQASMSYFVSRASDTDRKEFPQAASFEAKDVPKETSSGRVRMVYRVYRGWVAWSSSSGAWPWTGDTVYDSPVGGAMTRSIFYGEKMTSGTFPIAYTSVTNGVLWALVGKDINTYICDTHRAAAERKTGKTVYRSYVMNGAYGFDYNNEYSWKGLGLDHANRLMFAELPAREKWLSSSLSTAGADSVLDPDSNEYIGFNHKVGKRYAAHVAFADGHVEALLEPVSGSGTPSDSDLKALTEQLCDAEEIDVDLRRKMK